MSAPFRKLACVSYLAHHGKMQEAIVEAKKCRLLHGSCHIEHTRYQVRNGTGWIASASDRAALVAAEPHLADMMACFAELASKMTEDELVAEGDEVEVEVEEGSGSAAAAAGAAPL